MRLHKTITLVLSVVVSLISPATTLAFTQDQLNAVNRDRKFYLKYEEPCNNAVDDGSTVGGSPTNDNAKAAWDYFITKGLAPFRVAAIIGNLMQESHVNPKADNPAANPYGGGGGIAQWERDRWSGEFGLHSFVDATRGFTGQPKQGGGNWQDLGAQLNFMWWEMNNNRAHALRALRAATNITSATEEFEKKFEGAGTPMMNNRINFAKDALAKYGSGSADSGGVDPANEVEANNQQVVVDCITPDDAAAAGTGSAQINNLISTAMNYAWPSPNCGEKRGQRNCFIPKENYKADNVNKSGDDPYTDCGIFVATSVRKSGADPNYPVSGTRIQAEYIKKHPEKFSVIEKPSSTNQLLPGDILVYNEGGNGHTMIYVGPRGGAYPKVDGAWHAHAPQMGSAGGIQEMFRTSTVIAARFK